MPDVTVTTQENPPAETASAEVAAATAVNEASQAVATAAAAVEEATRVQQPWESALERISQEIRVALENLQTEIAGLKAPLSSMAELTAKTALVMEQTGELLALVAEAETIEETAEATPAAESTLQQPAESADRTSPDKPRRKRAFRLV